MLLSAHHFLRPLVLAATSSLLVLPVGGVGATERLDYSRDVRPILAANCFHCHGQDASHREADLRLDVREAPAGEEAHGAAQVVTPGEPAESELVARIISDDESLRMPPADSGKELKASEIETLRRWVEEGAEYQTHWAFVTPVRPTPPTVSDPSWVKNPIDAFVLAARSRTTQAITRRNAANAAAADVARSYRLAADAGGTCGV